MYIYIYFFATQLHPSIDSDVRSSRPTSSARGGGGRYNNNADRSSMGAHEQLHSATSILLTRELGYGLGPGAGAGGGNHSINYTMKSIR